MSYKHILVPVDGSDISFSAVKHAAEIAHAFEAQLILVSLVAEDPFNQADFYYSATIMKEYFVQAYANAQEALSQAHQMAAKICKNIDTKIIKGEVSAEQMVKTAVEVEADLIVMGSHGRKGFQKMILGSFAQDVLNKTVLPVLVVKK